MKKDWHIAIVGAGIGGLTAALTLQRFGFRVSVYEQAAEIKEIGAGVVIGPNGMRGLDFLDIGQAVRDNAGHAENTYIKNYATGEQIHMISLGATAEKHGVTNIFGHRADLHAALYGGVRSHDPDCVHPGHIFVGLDQDDRGVTVRFANGTEVRADVVIGADGNASMVRQSVFSPVPPEFTQQVSFRALVPADRWSDEIRSSPSACYIGPDRVFLHYPMRGNTVMNVIGTGRTPSWQEEGWAIPAQLSEFLDHYSDFCAPVRELIGQIEPDRLYKWGLRDRDPLTEWSKGRIVVMGDAAHPVTPFLGQGANMAIEDGVVLGRCFDKYDTIEEIFAHYEAARKERGTNAQLWSREQADALQGRTSAGLTAGRDAEDRGMFDYDPATVAI